MNRDSVKSSLDSIELSSSYVLELVDKIVDDCCGGLDKYIKYISGVLKDVSETAHALTDEELDDIILTLPTLLYFVGETQEKIGLKGDMSESTRKKLFSGENKVCHQMVILIFLLLSLFHQWDM